MGFTPDLVSGVWVGGEDRSIHFDGMADGQGASMALPIYGLYMQKVYGDQSLGYSQDSDFEIPEEYSDPCGGSSYIEESVTAPVESIEGYSIDFCIVWVVLTDTCVVLYVGGNHRYNSQMRTGTEISTMMPWKMAKMTYFSPRVALMRGRVVSMEVAPAAVIGANFPQ